jgi:hypothetical protein
VEQYRQRTSLFEAVPCREKLRGLPKPPFVGEASYQDIRAVLSRNRRWLTRPERLLVDDLIDYLAFKMRHVRFNEAQCQAKLHFVE